MLHSKSDLKEQLAGLMGGRVAEEIIFNAQTTGASNDFEQATQLARAMVTEYGMSEKLGPVQYEGSHAMMAGQLSPEKSYSPQTAQLIDDEVRALLNEARNKAADIINNNRETHKLIAEALNLPESTVCLVLYSYLAETTQEIVEEGSAKTLFGEMYLDENNQLQLQKKKFGLIELLDKKDIKEVYKICKDGPDYSIF
jgi:PHD/YefM family antitoxin component YafN of YafNO toxin-antitoxin module